MKEDQALCKANKKLFSGIMNRIEVTINDQSASQKSRSNWTIYNKHKLTKPASQTDMNSTFPFLRRALTVTGGLNLFRLLTLFGRVAVYAAPADSGGGSWAEQMRQRAQAGDAQAQNEVGMMYEKGLMSYPQDDKQAAQWYRKAAEQGHAIAQGNLGTLYMEGKGVPQDNAQALQWWNKAAAQGNAEAQYNLGVAYGIGQGVTKDYGQAKSWFQKSANQGDAQAQNELGMMYYDSLGVKQNLVKARQWFQKAADQGNADGENNIGMMIVKGEGGFTQDLKAAAGWYQKAADQGHVDAQYKLGAMYANGWGEPKDYGQAAAWFKKAADQGDARAQSALGVMYANGVGVKEDPAEAFKLFEQGANQGNAEAQYNLGSMYDQGQGVVQNSRQAAQWYQKAADQGMVNAQYNLGIDYEQGIGVAQDKQKAIELYQKAAAQGYQKAQARLSGLQGQPWGNRALGHVNFETDNKWGGVFTRYGNEAEVSTFMQGVQPMKPMKKLCLIAIMAGMLQLLAACSTTKDPCASTSCVQVEPTSIVAETQMSAEDKAAQQAWLASNQNVNGTGVFNQAEAVHVNGYTILFSNGSDQLFVLKDKDVLVGLSGGGTYIYDSDAKEAPGAKTESVYFKDNYIKYRGKDYIIRDFGLDGANVSKTDLNREEKSESYLNGKKCRKTIIPGMACCQDGKRGIRGFAFYDDVGWVQKEELDGVCRSPRRVASKRRGKSIKKPG